VENYETRLLYSAQSGAMEALTDFPAVLAAASDADGSHAPEAALDQQIGGPLGRVAYRAESLPRGVV
jgi:hypothetical protein